MAFTPAPLSSESGPPARKQRGDLAKAGPIFNEPLVAQALFTPAKAAPALSQFAIAYWAIRVHTGESGPANLGRGTANVRLRKRNELPVAHWKLVSLWPNPPAAFGRGARFRRKWRRCERHLIALSQAHIRSTPSQIGRPAFAV